MEELQEVRAQMVKTINEISSQPNSYMVECMVIAQRAMLRIVEGKIKEIENKVSKTVDK